MEVVRNKGLRDLDLGSLLGFLDNQGISLSAVEHVRGVGVRLPYVAAQALGRGERKGETAPYELHNIVNLDREVNQPWSIDVDVTETPDGLGYLVTMQCPSHPDSHPYLEKQRIRFGFAIDPEQHDWILHATGLMRREDYQPPTA